MDGLFWKTIRTISVVLLLAWPAAGYADEVLMYDEAMYAPLENALASDNPVIVKEDRKDKEMYVTRYIVDGESADEWNESLEVVETHLKDQPKTLDDWYAEFTALFLYRMPLRRTYGIEMRSKLRVPIVECPRLILQVCFDDFEGFLPLVRRFAIYHEARNVHLVFFQTILFKDDEVVTR